MVNTQYGGGEKARGGQTAVINVLATREDAKLQAGTIETEDKSQEHLLQLGDSCPSGEGLTAFSRKIHCILKGFLSFKDTVSFEAVSSRDVCLHGTPTMSQYSAGFQGYGMLQTQRPLPSRR